MSIRVTFECNGCDATAEGTARLLQRQRDPATVAPEGWVPFDPYTGVCYCPKCWAEIEAPE